MSENEPRESTDPFENTIFETLRIPREEMARPQDQDGADTVDEDGELPTIQLGSGDDPTLVSGGPVPGEQATIADTGEDPTMVLGTGPGPTGGPTGSPTGGPTGGSTAAKPTETFIPARHQTGSTGFQPGGLEPGEAPVELERGNQIRQYRLDAQVGKGGQGVVWLGFDSLAERQVALKFLPAAMARDARAMKEMREEASVLFDLTHEGIVRLNTIEQAGGYAFLVMEYLGGQSVQQVLKARVAAGQSGLTVDECLWLLDQIAPPLDYANAKGVTHRDIKPANVMLTAPVSKHLGEEEGIEAKICDFGIAFVTSTQMNELEGFVPIGTVPFMSPEVLGRKKPTPAADVYSLAASLYYLFKGRPPFGGEDLVRKIREDVVPPLNSGDADFDAAIHAALSKDPLARPETARDLLFQASGGRLGGEEKTSALKAILTTAGILTAVAAAVIAYLLFGRSSAANILGPEPDVAFNSAVPLQFTIDDLSVESVKVGVMGSGVDYYTSLSSETGEFEASVLIPAQDGEFTIEILDAVDGKQLGSRTFVADTTLDAALQDITFAGGPFDIGEPLTLDFAFREGVRIETTDGDLIDNLATGSGNASVSLAELPATKDTTDKTLNVRVVDGAGNSDSFPLKLPVYDRAALVADLAQARFPLEDREWSPRELNALNVELTGWKDRVLEEQRLTDENRTYLLTGDNRGTLADRLERRLEARGDVEIEIFAGQGLDEVHESGAIDIYTKERSYLLRGAVADSQSGTVELQVVGGESTELDLDPEGLFEYPVNLGDGESTQLVVKAAGRAEPQDIKVIHDATVPDVVELVVDGQAYDLDDSTFELRVNTGSIHVETKLSEAVGSVGIADASFEFLEGAQWGGTVPLEAGLNELVQKQEDRAGNVSHKTVKVFYDNAGPALVSWSPLGDVPFTGSTVQKFEAHFDEDLGEVFGIKALFTGEGGSSAVTAINISEHARSVEWQLVIPDEDGSLSVVIEARDGLETLQVHERSWKVNYDPWGAFPTESRHLFERLEAPPWAADHAQWNDYSIDEGRWPTAIKHVASGLELVFVHSGSFELGENEKKNKKGMPSFGPAVEVSMSRFYIGRTEVAARHDAPGDFAAPLTPLKFTYDEAYAWSNSRGMNLPTEAQWEYAASGPENRRYPWGVGLVQEVVNARIDTLGATRVNAVVDGFASGASWCLARHMSGNVDEFCLDRLDFEALEPGRDPVGELTYTDRAHLPIYRGGTVSTNNPQLLATFGRAQERNRHGLHGFRPVFVPAK